MKYELPQGYQLRPVTMQDLEPVIEMFNVWAQEMLGVRKFEAQGIGREWHTPGFDLWRDTRLVTAPDGQVAGYMEIWDLNDPHVRVNCWGRVHPEHEAAGVGPALLAWAEERARQAVPKAPAQARVALVTGVLSIDQAGQRHFQQAGFKLVRHSLRMVIELNGKPPAPCWPPGMTVQTMRLGQQERAVVQAVRESFQDHFGYVESPFEDEFARWEHFMQNDEDFEPSLWFVAMDGDEVAGISLCYRKVADDPEMGWVGTLGVRRAWRRRGLGLALLQHSFQEFHRRGNRRVGLGVDAQNLTGATRLYLRAGMQPDPQRQFYLYEKELRPGIELSTQTAG